MEPSTGHSRPHSWTARFWTPVVATSTRVLARAFGRAAGHELGLGPSVHDPVSNPVQGRQAGAGREQASFASTSFLSPGCRLGSRDGCRALVCLSGLFPIEIKRDLTARLEKGFTSRPRTSSLRGASWCTRARRAPGDRRRPGSRGARDGGRIGGGGVSHRRPRGPTVQCPQGQQ
jgi:hypothetical protein